MLYRGTKSRVRLAPKTNAPTKPVPKTDVPLLPTASQVSFMMMNYQFRCLGVEFIQTPPCDN